MSKDYFNHRNELPANIENILYEFGSVEEYNEAMELQSQLELQGWTFEMGLDCEPYDLHKMPEKYEKQCAECGGEKVYNTSRSYWNVEAQEWKLDCHLTDDTYCDDCEAMVEINDIKL